MSVSFPCPECGVEHDLDPSLVGKKFACACGTVTEVEGGGDAPTSCPACHAEVPQGNVLCTSCGHNLQTGQQLSVDSRDDEAPSFWEKHGRLVVRLVILLILASGATFVYLQVTKKHYGIRSSLPLGTVAAVEAHIGKMGLELVTERSATGAAGVASLKKYKDARTEDESKGVMLEHVYLAAGEDGSMRAIGGSFHTIDPSVPSPQPPIGQFLRHYLTEVGCGKPCFEIQKGGSGMFGATQYAADFKGSGFQGRWVQVEGSGLIATSDEVVIVRTGTEPGVFKELGLVAPSQPAAE